MPAIGVLSVKMPTNLLIVTSLSYVFDADPLHKLIFRNPTV